MKTQTHCFIHSPRVCLLLCFFAYIHCQEEEYTDMYKMYGHVLDIRMYADVLNIQIGVDLA